MQTKKTTKNNFQKCLDEFPFDKINLRKDFYENKKKLIKTPLFEYFKKMPKGVLNHIHFPAFNSVEDWIEILKHDVTVKNVKNRTYSFEPKGRKLKSGFRR